LIKEHISTVEENNGMYSTDDEDFNETKNDDDDGSSVMS